MSTLTVGAGEEYATLSAAVAASQDGDVIQVQAGTYTNDFAEVTHKITIEGVGGTANFVATESIPNGKAILITDTAGFGDQVEAAVAQELRTLPRAAIASASWADFGAIIEVENLDQAVPLADAIAAEHLEIMTADPEALSAHIRNAGAIFLGAHTPEAIGDYVGGSNHVLPTARSARFSSGLGVLDKVNAAAGTSSAVGEGLADALNVGGI